MKPFRQKIAKNSSQTYNQLSLLIIFLHMQNTARNLYRPHPISVNDYQKMAETGILNETARVELIAGEIIDMAPIGSRHAAMVNRLMRLLVNATANAAIVSVQNPIVLGDYSEPEPDIALLKPKANDYEDALPTAQDILLLIEVADSTLLYDRQIKAPLYAEFAIPELWLIDIQQSTMTIFQQPIDKNYSLELKINTAAAVTPLLLPDVKLNLQKVLKAS